MNYLNELIYLLSVLAFAILSIQVFYLLVFSVAGWLAKTKVYPEASMLGSFAIYIPAYKEDAVILETAMAALTLDYPAVKRKIIVIADSLQAETIDKLKKLPIELVEVLFDKSTKAKALNTALSQTRRNYDYALILDADNICDKKYLQRMNDALQAGYKVVQGQRVAKNTNTAFALLDAISEGINNHIFRKGHCALGLSSAIIGSGMALDFNLFNEIIPEITAVGGFDKEMELRLLKRKIKFGYAENAVVFDEKTQRAEVFQNQRKRWLSAQLNYLKLYFADGFIQLFKGNLDFFDKVLQTMLLPRIMIIGILPVLFVLSFLIRPVLSPLYWLSLAAAAYTAIFIAVPATYRTRKLLGAAGRLPLAFFMMARLFFKLKGANNTFIHTPHGETK
ncbi:glycosyltransferase [Mucilaginibacter celer]|uniref:Glycosyltransferase n=1 Tax=Mucilaginibacter celer TaxID=2305508 RepID=A0A494VKZ2_9SPHI|nr:glycosyltransferase [Mucilaginibacter celer]AYL95164.1 glycosyltransferase [Mucilaginibacter celer]